MPLVHFCHPKHAPRATTHALPNVWPNTLSRSSPNKPYVAGNKAPQCALLLLAPSAQIDLPAAPRLKRTWQPPPPAGHHDHTMQACKPPWEFLFVRPLFHAQPSSSNRTTCEDEDASHKRVKKKEKICMEGMVCWCVVSGDH